MDREFDGCTILYREETAISNEREQTQLSVEGEERQDKTADGFIVSRVDNNVTSGRESADKP